MKWSLTSYFLGVITVPAIVIILLVGIFLLGSLEARRKRITEWVETFSANENDELVFFNKKGEELVRATKEKIYFPGSPVPLESPTRLEKGYEASIGGQRFRVEENTAEKLKSKLF